MYIRKAKSGRDIKITVQWICSMRWMKILKLKMKTIHFLFVVWYICMPGSDRLIRRQTKDWMNSEISLIIIIQKKMAWIHIPQFRYQIVLYFCIVDIYMDLSTLSIVWYFVCLHVEFIWMFQKMSRKEYKKKKNISFILMFLN